MSEASSIARQTSEADLRADIVRLGARLVELKAERDDAVEAMRAACEAIAWAKARHAGICDYDFGVQDGARDIAIDIAALGVRRKF